MRPAKSAICANAPVPFRFQIRSSGSVDAPEFDGRSGQVRAMVEKPAPDDAPSPLAVVGRYVLEPRIFELLENTQPGKGGEIQLTDAIARLLDERPVHPYHFEGTRFDCGSHLGLIEATIQFAIDHEKLSEGAARAMRDTLAELGGVER